MQCRCRHCGRKYEEAKSRADYKGYCSQACLHDEARRQGYRPPTRRPPGHQGRTRNPVEQARRIATTEYGVLKAAGKIGSVPWED